MSTMYKLTEVEAFRAQVLLEEALKKLLFLTSISSSASVHGDELTQFMGDEISRIIQEQRDLEKKYEELIAQRGMLKGLTNKAKFKDIQREIQDVAHRLKGSNISLCRNLKENPNVQGNVHKMNLERSQVQEWLEETKTDLVEWSFANLVAKVEDERREQERLTEVRKKENQTTAQVRTLEEELKREQADHEKEGKQAMLEIKELKEELQKSKTISDIEFKFEEKKLRAREQDLLRTQAQKEKALKEELEELEKGKDMEKTTHERAIGYLNHKKEGVEKEKDKWSVETEREIRERQEELERLREKRAAAAEELEHLEEQRAKEFEMQRQKEEEMRNAVLIHKQRQDQIQRMHEAVLLLQEEGREYILRIQARNAAKKGKKKKKGGKKK